jgi:hypothetical protein
MQAFSWLVMSAQLFLREKKDPDILFIQPELFYFTQYEMHRLINHFFFIIHKLFSFVSLVFSQKINSQIRN